MVLGWSVRFCSMRFYLDRFEYTFQNEGLEFIVDPLFKSSFALNSFFFQIIEAIVELSFSCFDPWLNCPLNFFLLVLLILDFFLDIWDHFEYFRVLITFDFLIIEKFVLFLIELVDESAMHLGFAGLWGLLKGVEFLKEGCGCLFVFIFCIFGVAFGGGSLIDGDRVHFLFRNWYKKQTILERQWSQ